MTGTPAHRVEILDPLRGVAALAVAWFHFTNVFDGWIRVSGMYGWIGVEMFFVISGFVLPLSLWRGGYRIRQHFFTFVVKRVVRLDPPYLVTIALTIALAYASAMAPGFAGQQPDFTWRQVLLHLGYLNAFFGEPWIVDVFWTLAVEFQFYLLIAFVYPVLERAGSQWRGFLIIGLALLGLAFSDGPVAILSDRPYVTLYLPVFGLGIATSYHYRGEMRSAVYLAVVATTGVVAGFTLGWPVAAASVLTALAIAFVRVPIHRVWAFVGAISYSVYLLHVPIGGRVINLGGRWAHTVASELLTLGLALAVSLIAAYAMYRWIERPSQRLSSAIRYRRELASNTASRPVHRFGRAPLSDPAESAD